MRHLDDGTLRRMMDEPLAITQMDREHYTNCPECQSLFTRMAADTAYLTNLMAEPAGSADTTRALARFHTRIASQPRMAEVGRSVIAAPRQDRLRWLRKPAATVALVAALVGTFTLTPAGSLAQSVITVFQPQQVAVISIDPSDLTALPHLRKFGTIHIEQRAKSVQVADAGAAGAQTGMHVLVPGTLPSQVPAGPTYEVVPGASATFTFSAAKAQQEAAKEGKTLPPMPANIDGSTLRVTLGATAAAMYGASKGGIPTLVVGQMVAPKVESSGVPLQNFEDYVLSLPGVSPQLAAQIRALGDPMSTLPIPIPVSLAHADQVTVQGAKGYSVGDSTGIGSGVLWEKDGVIYVVAGTLSQSDVLSIANSLH